LSRPLSKYLRQVYTIPTSKTSSSGLIPSANVSLAKASKNSGGFRNIFSPTLMEPASKETSSGFKAKGVSLSAIGFLTAKAIVAPHKKGSKFSVIPVIDGPVRVLALSYRF
jgi:hypothetical protein